jgi:hypothetical protein
VLDGFSLIGQVAARGIHFEAIPANGRSLRLFNKWRSAADAITNINFNNVVFAMTEAKPIQNDDGRLIGYVEPTDHGRYQARHILIPLGLYRRADIAADVVREFARDVTSAAD